MPRRLTSPNEQDQRHLARMLGLPVLDPATPQEALEMTRFAFGMWVNLTPRLTRVLSVEFKLNLLRPVGWPMLLAMRLRPAMREILVNALIHRDYTIAGGAVSLAIFDDRVEVWSAGKFPNGITPESLRQAHLSVHRRRRLPPSRPHREVGPRHEPRQRNVPGCEHRSTRVRRDYRGGGGHLPGAGGERGGRVDGMGRVRGRVGAESLEQRVLGALAIGELSKSALASRLGLRSVTGRLNRVVLSLVRRGVIEYTIPEKPGSRLQKYRRVRHHQE